MALTRPGPTGRGRTWSKEIILDQSGAFSLVGIVEIVLSLVKNFIEQKYFYDVATPAPLCHKGTALIIGPFRAWKPPIPYAGSLWHKRAGASNSSYLE